MTLYLALTPYLTQSQIKAVWSSITTMVMSLTIWAHCVLNQLISLITQNSLQKKKKKEKELGNSFPSPLPKAYYHDNPQYLYFSKICWYKIVLTKIHMQKSIKIKNLYDQNWHYKVVTVNITTKLALFLFMVQGLIKGYSSS